jgi:parallel beta-helix repeat protein
LASPPQGESRTLVVPTEYSAIRRALAEAAGGDTVFVRKGIYKERFSIGDSVTLIGQDPENCIVVGRWHRPVIRGADHVLIKNLTLKGGSKGILCDNKRMTIEGNVITGNREAGIHCLVSLPVIRNNVISRNKWTGILCESVRSIENSIEHNVIADNGYSGLMLAGRTEVLVQNNVFFDNRQYGIWVGEESRKSRIEYNNIYDNRRPFNINAVVGNTNVSLDPAFIPKFPDSYDYRRKRAAPLRGLGRDGTDIGLVSEAQIERMVNDADGDSVFSDNDKCPNVAEDRDGFDDRDGCPDFDNDGDGLYDSADECPDQPEDIDGFSDQDGCPDSDNDNDGIRDAEDECPLKPETANGYKDDDGCPDEKP